MLNATRLSHKGRLMCTAPIGLADTESVKMFGLPGGGESTLLIVALGLFFLAAYLIFRRWGKPETSSEAIVFGPLQDPSGTVAH
jgi:hypothetical protein